MDVVKLEVEREDILVGLQLSLIYSLIYRLQRPIESQGSINSAWPFS